MADFSQIIINCLSSGQKLTFDSFITEYSEDISPKWSSKEMYGKMDPIYTFQNTKKKVKLTFDVPSDNLEAATFNYNQIMALLDSLYPGYDTGEISTTGASIVNTPPLFMITFGSYLDNVSCIIQDISFSPQLESGFFTEEREYLFLYPKLVKLSLSLDILHRKRAETGFYMKIEEQSRTSDGSKPVEEQEALTPAEEARRAGEASSEGGEAVGSTETVDPCAGLSKKDRKACEKSQKALAREDKALEKKREEERKAQKAREEQAAKAEQLFSKLAEDVEKGNLEVGSKEYLKRKKDAEAARRQLTETSQKEADLEKEIARREAAANKKKEEEKAKFDEKRKQEEKAQKKRDEEAKRLAEKKAEEERKVAEKAAAKKKADEERAAAKAAAKRAQEEAKAAAKAKAEEEAKRKREEEKARREAAKSDEQKAREKLERERIAAEARASANAAAAKKSSPEK